MGLVIALIVLLILLVIFLGSSIKIIRQQRLGIVERLGKFQKQLTPGPHVVIPFIDRVTERLDMREQVVQFPPQAVITEENLMVSIDSVIYFQIIDPIRANYEAQNYTSAIEQLTQTTLRNIVGGMDLDTTLTSRDEINGKLRVVLDEATGKWGIKVNRVELRSIEPPPTIRDAMEKTARAEREKRAQILLAEGQRQSQILNAGGDRESSILRAQGDREAQVLRAQADRQAQMLRAEGEAQAITTVFNAIHAGEPDQSLLSYQYLQMLPAIARGDANKVWMIPSEITKALEGLGGVIGDVASGIPQHSQGKFTAPEKVDVFAEIEKQKVEDEKLSQQTVEKAVAEAQALERGAVPVHPHHHPDKDEQGEHDDASAEVGASDGDGPAALEHNQQPPAPQQPESQQTPPPPGPAGPAQGSSFAPPPGPGSAASAPPPPQGPPPHQPHSGSSAGAYEPWGPDQQPPGPQRPYGPSPSGHYPPQ